MKYCVKKYLYILFIYFLIVCLYVKRRLKKMLKNKISMLELLSTALLQTQLHRPSFEMDCLDCIVYHLRWTRCLDCIVYTLRWTVFTASSVIWNDLVGGGGEVRRSYKARCKTFVRIDTVVYLCRYNPQWNLTLANGHEFVDYLQTGNINKMNPVVKLARFIII